MIPYIKTTWDLNTVDWDVGLFQCHNKSGLQLLSRKGRSQYTD